MFSQKNKQITGDSFSEVDFHSTVKQKEGTSPVDKINGAGASSVPPFSPNVSDPLADESANGWSSSVHALLNEPPASLSYKFIIGGVIFCILFVAWTFFGTVEEVGKAQGKLVPEGETYNVEPIELGQVQQVLVKEGQEVQAGQLLVKLDTELAKNEVERLQQMITAYQMELNQKQIWQDKVELEAKTQAEISSAKLQAQRLAITLAEEKRATLKRLLAQQAAEAEAYRLRQIQRKPLVAIADERLRQLEAEKVAHQQRIERVRPLQEEGAVSQEFLFQAKQALRETEQRITFSKLQEVTNANEQIFEANQALRDLKAQILQNQGDLLIANKEIEKAQAELIAQESEAEKIQLEAKQKIEQLNVEITQLQGKISETQNLLVSAQTKLQNKYLRAPVSGIVLSLDLKNTGEVLEPGNIVAEIAPEGVELVVSATLPNKEAGFIEPGMPVQVKLDAYPYQDYGVIPGRVMEISADAESDEQLGEVYRLEIKLEKDHVTENGKVIAFKAGQTLSADIIIRRRRIIDVLLDPIKQIQKDGINL